jgi:ATP-dependent DNA helicase RecG
MLRLLQGDVGSGKTVVALLAAAAVIEAGSQAAWEGPAWSRLAYDEMLAGQLALGLVRAHMRRRGGRPHRATRPAPARARRGAAPAASAPR